MGVPEIAYIVEKLYNMIVYHSSQAALKEATCKEMEARLLEVMRAIQIWSTSESTLDRNNGSYQIGVHFFLLFF